MLWLFLTYCVCRFLMKLFSLFFFFFCFQNLSYCLQESERDFFQLLLVWLQFGLLRDCCVPAFPGLFVLHFLQAALKKSKNVIVWSVSARDSSWCSAGFPSAVCPAAPCAPPRGSANRAGGARRKRGLGWLSPQQDSSMCRPDAA